MVQVLLIWKMEKVEVHLSNFKSMAGIHAIRQVTHHLYDLPNSRVLNSLVQSKITLVAFKAARLALLIFKSTGVME